MAADAKWYVAHTYSGYEDKVKSTLEKAVKSRGLDELIVEVLVPKEKKQTAGKEKIIESKIFPGYVLVKMVLTDSTWHVVRNTRGVTGFVGADSKKPTPLTDEEALALGAEKHVTLAPYTIGDRVNILDGTFEGFNGTVTEINAEADSVTVVVRMFGRDTPLDLKYDKVSLKE